MMCVKSGGAKEINTGVKKMINGKKKCSILSTGAV